MQHLFTPEGEAALAAVMAKKPLMAFDFDGTLTPIVPHPDDAHLAPQLAVQLQALGQRLPLAIVTGRSVADVRPRLGFAPRFLLGSHGAEDENDPQGTAARRAALDGLRGKLRERARELAAAGVMVEDKGVSMALHYRQASDPAAAQALIARLTAPWQGPLHVYGGKMVVNAVVADAPDKAHAVQSLVARSGAAAAFFAGDDVNDEPVFAAAPSHWLTLRIGRDEPGSRARFGLDSPAEMPQLLDRVLLML